MYELDVPLLLVIIVAMVVFTLVVLRLRKLRRIAKMPQPLSWKSIYEYDQQMGH